MTKFFCLALACVMFAPMLATALHQAAQITA
jgi:hypothetical protein